MAARFTKAPAGIHVSSGATKGGSAKEGGRPPAPPGHLERPPPPDFAKRTAVLVPCQDFAVLDSPFLERVTREARRHKFAGSGKTAADRKGPIQRAKELRSVKDGEPKPQSWEGRGFPRSKRKRLDEPEGIKHLRGDDGFG